MATIDRVQERLGKEPQDLLNYQCRGLSWNLLHLPGSDFVSRVLAQTDRPMAVLRNFQALISHGRLADTGYFSILPVDQGVEHSAGAGLITGRKAFQRPMDEGIKLLNLVQDIYLEPQVKLA
jgi:class I fructose-bisphosphate aldolase